MKIVRNARAPMPLHEWQNTKLLHVYGSPAEDLLVLNIGAGKALALVVSGASSTKVGHIWSPGSASTWIELDTTLQIHGVVKNDQPNG